MKLKDMIVTYVHDACLSIGEEQVVPVAALRLVHEAALRRSSVTACRNGKRASEMIGRRSAPATWFPGRACEISGQVLLREVKRVPTEVSKV